MSFTRRYGIPFLIMIVSGLIVRLFNLYLPVSIRSTLVTIAIAVSLFAFGLSLHIHKKRRDESWFNRFPATEIDFQFSGNSRICYLYGLCVLRLGVFRLIARIEENLAGRLLGKTDQSSNRMVPKRSCVEPSRRAIG